MRKEFVRKALGYVLAIVFILAGWELTALAVNNAALPGCTSATCGRRFW